MGFLNRSLYARLLIAFLALAIVPLALTSYVSYAAFRHGILDDSESKLSGVATLKEQEIRRWAERLSGTLSWVAANPSRAAEMGTLSTFPAGSDEYQAAHESLTDDAGRLANEGQFTVVLLARSDTGQVVVASEPGWLGRSADSEWHLNEGRSATFVSEVFVSSLIGRPTIVVSTPVKDRSGRLTGVLVGYADVKELNDLMTEWSGLGDTGETFLVNEATVLVTDIRFEPGSAFKKIIMGQGAQRAVQGMSGAGTWIDYRQMPVVGVYRWLDDRKLGLIVKQDEVEALASATRQRNVAWTITVATAVGVAVVCWLMAGSVAHPLARLAGYSRRIQDGDYSAEIIATGNDEVAAVTASVKSMVARLLETTEALEQSNAELLAVNKELEAFSYSVSHDLRAPLRAIDGFSLAVVEDCSDKLDENGKGYLERVRAATQRMGLLIDDLLNLSRIGRVEMRRVDVDLSSLAREIAADLKKTQPERLVEFAISDDLRAKGDPALFRIILENLLGNAWKFTGKHPRAKIEFGYTRREGREVFFVKDDGAGFDMAYAQKLFSPFQRLHMASDFPGTGIGLATVQRIIRRHGGSVWAEAGVEQGATFYFVLGEHPKGERQ